MRNLKEMEKQARELGDVLKSVMPPGQGFFLALYDLGDETGNLTYLSNGNRADSIRMLRELVKKLETKCV